MRCGIGSWGGQRPSLADYYLYREQITQRDVSYFANYTEAYERNTTVMKNLAEKYNRLLAERKTEARGSEANGQMAAAQAHAHVERLFALLHECRALLPTLETARTPTESPSAEAERLLYNGRPMR